MSHWGASRRHPGMVLRGFAWVVLTGVGACAPRQGEGPVANSAAHSSVASESPPERSESGSERLDARRVDDAPFVSLALSTPRYVPAYAGREVVSVGELVEALGRGAETIGQAPTVRHEYARLLEAHGLLEHEVPYHDYLVVRVVFEATRDGGLWGIVWDVTNREGHSDAIWRQWQTAVVPARDEWGVTAVAECDEMSALFAFLVRRLGIEHAGFLGGGPMHVVAHWTLRLAAREARVVVPTSQVFLSRQATLGTREIDAYSAKTVWDYWRADVPLTATIPAPLARYFVEQLPLAALPQTELQRRRNRFGRS